jgi:predicted DsbA family dithiol-disulfide isomerase
LVNVLPCRTIDPKRGFTMENNNMLKAAIKPVIKIAVVSDVVCPWCYIGKRRMENAVKSLSDEFDFDIAYYPFELNADMPLSGKNQKEYLSKKFGDESEYERLTGHVTEVASQEGLVFDYSKQSVSPNTRNAHRLILFAKDSGKNLEMVEALFKAYFTDGIDLSKIENLVAIAETVGLDRSKVELFLASDAGTAEIIMAERELQKMGISGVPFYIINDQYGVSGAQSSQTFIQAFQNVAKELSLKGEACDVDGKNC